MGRKQPIKRTTATRQQPSKPRTATPNTPTPTPQDTSLYHPPLHTIPTPQPQPPIVGAQFIAPTGTGATPSSTEDHITGDSLFSHTLHYPFSWLWQDRLPRGSVTLLDGPLGSGKSLLALHIAACLTSGQPFPDGTPSTPISTLILIAPCTNASHILRPRLDAAGGDSTRVHLLNRVEGHDKHDGTYMRSFTLTQDLLTLELTIRQLHAPLVILDTPELARPALLRRLLPNLTSLAERTNCAILLIRPIVERPITHKNGTLQPNTDALDLLSAVPSRLLIAPNPDNNKQSLLITSKHTFSPQPPILLFDIIPSPSGTPILDWQGHYQPPAPPDDQPAPAPQSLHRQHILEYLQKSHTSQDAPTIATAINHSYDATRKLLQYMLHDSQLTSPARGLYTTPDHHSQAPQPTDIATTATTPTLPSIPTLPIIPNATAYNPDLYNPDMYGRDAYGHDSSRPVHVPTIPNSDVATTETTSTLPSIPIVTPSTNERDISVYFT